MNRPNVKMPALPPLEPPSLEELERARRANALVAEPPPPLGVAPCRFAQSPCARLCPKSHRPRS